jgi:hypothetical protein
MMNKTIKFLLLPIAVIGAVFSLNGVALAQYGSGLYGQGAYNQTSDTTAPTISSVSSVPAQTTATISWTTNEPATSEIDYGVNTGYGSASLSATLVTAHSITLTGLASNTLYNFRVSSEDAASNTRTSANFTFTTLSAPLPGDTIAPIISMVQQVPTPSTDTTPSFVLNSNESGVLSFAGNCSSPVVNVQSGNTTVTLNALAVGTYSNCTVRVTDASNNVSNQVQLNSFTITATTVPPTTTEPPSSSGGTRTTSRPSSSNSGNNTVGNTYKNSTIPLGVTFGRNISFIQPMYNNSQDIIHLKTFLNEFEGENLTINSIYSPSDVAAVMRFQTKYRRQVLDVWRLPSATGYVGITTRLKMNSLLKNITTSCPAFVEYNGGLSGIMQSEEIRRTQEILEQLDLYNGPLNGTWDAATNAAMIRFQETFSDVMLKPWNLSKGTGYKFKTTNVFLNYFVGCETGPVQLDATTNFRF